GDGAVERPDVDPGVTLAAVEQRRVLVRLAAEDLDHLVAVAAPLRLEVLPLLRALVDAHVLDRERPHAGPPRAPLLLLCALDVVAGLALLVLDLRFLRRARLAVELNQALPGKMDSVLAVVDADPAPAEAFGGLAGGAGAHEAVEDEAPGRA